MANNAQKTHLALDQNRFAEQKVLAEIAVQGRALPCSVTAVSGSIVTVSFQVNTAPYVLSNVTMPIATPIYRREPTQIGDLGVTMPCDVYIGIVSGLGTGIPDLSLPSNLSALVWVPTGNANWPPPIDPNKYEIWGPAGAIVRDKTSASIITLTNSTITIVETNGNITISASAGNITLVASEQITLQAPVIALDGYLTQTATPVGGYGAQIQGPVQVIEDVVAAGISVSTHVHGGVETGGGETGEPVG